MNLQWDDSTNWYIHLIGFYSAIKMGEIISNYIIRDKSRKANIEYKQFIKVE